MSLPSFKELSAGIPGVSKTVSEALEEVLGRRGRSPAQVKAAYSLYLDEVQVAAFETYLKYEREAWDNLVGENPQVLKGNFEAFYSLFQSITQSRKARAGSAFEEIIRGLFRQLEYPFEEQAVVNGKPDFILPSAARYREDPRDTIIFTAKRTIRERWRQVATEGTRGLGQFLATIDRAVAKNALDEMMTNRIYLVVPRSAKQDVTAYADSETVISFEDFFEDYLDPAMRRWKKGGVVE